MTLPFWHASVAIVRVLNKKETDDVKASVEKMTVHSEKNAASQNEDKKMPNAQETVKTSAAKPQENKINADGTEDIDISFFQ